MQGKYGVWVIGGGASYETTNSVMQYNRMLLKQASLPQCQGKVGT